MRPTLWILTAGALVAALSVTAAVSSTAPKTEDAAATVTQVRITQRIASAAVRRSNSALSLLAPVNAGSKPGWPGTAIASNAITTAKIAANAVTAADIASNAVTTPKIANGAVTSAKLAAGAVGAGQIANASITGAKLVNDTVGTTQMANGAVTTAKIANGAVGTAQIGNAAVGGAQIASGGVALDNLASAVATRLFTSTGLVKLANGQTVNILQAGPFTFTASCSINVANVDTVTVTISSSVDGAAFEGFDTQNSFGPATPATDREYAQDSATPTGTASIDQEDNGIAVAPDGTTVTFQPLTGVNALGNPGGCVVSGQALVTVA